MAAELDRLGRGAPTLPGGPGAPGPSAASVLPAGADLVFGAALPGNLAYNAQATIRLRGPLDAEALSATITEVVRLKHEIFRTAFSTLDGVPMQEVRPPMTVRLPVVDLQDVPEADRERRTEEVVQDTIRRPFELTDPPLARWLLIRHAADDHTLVQVEHHFVHDGWSFGVLLDEIRAIYPELAAGSLNRHLCPNRPSSTPTSPPGSAPGCATRSWTVIWSTGRAT